MKKKSKKLYPPIPRHHWVMVVIILLFGLGILFKSEVKSLFKTTIFAQKRNLQLEKYEPPQNFSNTIVGQIWLKECKPAIYVYPESRQLVRVKVEPEGYFTYLDPAMQNGQWTVDVETDGTFESHGKQYTYLYYESALRKSEVPVPARGFVVPFGGLKSLFETILPTLGLNNSEKNDFIEYWTNTLPFFPYYFVGFLERADIDRLEKLSIDPHPDSIVRVRFYFKPLSSYASVNLPILNKQTRSGYLVVEWGGIVDLGKKDFICSQ